MITTTAGKRKLDSLPLSNTKSSTRFPSGSIACALTPDGPLSRAIKNIYYALLIMTLLITNKTHSFTLPRRPLVTKARIFGVRAPLLLCWSHDRALSLQIECCATQAFSVLCSFTFSKVQLARKCNLLKCFSNANPKEISSRVSLMLKSSSL